MYVCILVLLLTPARAHYTPPIHVHLEVGVPTMYSCPRQVKKGVLILKNVCFPNCFFQVGFATAGQPGLSLVCGVARFN